MEFLQLRRGDVHALKFESNFLDVILEELVEGSHMLVLCDRLSPLAVVPVLVELKDCEELVD